MVLKHFIAKTPKIQNKENWTDGLLENPSSYIDLWNQEKKLDRHQLCVIGCQDNRHVSLGRELFRCEETPWHAELQFLPHTSLSFALARSVLLEQTCGWVLGFPLRFLKHVNSTKIVSMATAPTVAYSTVPDQKQDRWLNNLTYPQASVSSWYSCTDSTLQMIRNSPVLMFCSPPLVEFEAVRLDGILVYLSMIYIWKH